MSADDLKSLHARLFLLERYIRNELERLYTLYVGSDPSELTEEQLLLALKTTSKPGRN